MSLKKLNLKEFQLCFAKRSLGRCAINNLLTAEITPTGVIVAKS
jgi:hypothetical protein